MIEEPKLREFYGKNAKTDMEKYSSEIIYNKWYNVISELTTLEPAQTLARVERVIPLAVYRNKKSKIAA